MVSIITTFPPRIRIPGGILFSSAHAPKYSLFLLALCLHYLIVLSHPILPRALYIHEEKLFSLSLMPLFVFPCFSPLQIKISRATWHELPAPLAPLFVACFICATSFSCCFTESQIGPFLDDWFGNRITDCFPSFSFLPQKKEAVYIPKTDVEYF